MKTIQWMLLSALTVAAPQMAVAASTGDFTRCPTVGQGGTTVPGIGLATCAAIFTINGFSPALQDYAIQGQALTSNNVNVVLPYDGSDDALVGVLNMSGTTISSLSLGVNGAGIGATGQPIFGFDGDGLCASSIIPHPAGCPFEVPADPFGGQTYAGPATRYTFVNNNPLSVDPRGGARSGTISFVGGLADGAFTYFSLEDVIQTCPTLGCSASAPLLASVPDSLRGPAVAAAPTNVQLSAITLQATVLHTAADVAVGAVPEPGSVVFIGAGLVFLGSLRFARKVRARF